MPGVAIWQAWVSDHLARVSVGGRYLHDRMPFSSNQPEDDGDGCVDLDEGGVRLLIWRRGYDMCMEPLDESSWTVLKSFRDGRDLAAACDILKDPVPNADMAKVLPALVQRGWIASFTL